MRFLAVIEEPRGSSGFSALWGRGVRSRVRAPPDAEDWRDHSQITLSCHPVPEGEIRSLQWRSRRLWGRISTGIGPVPVKLPNPVRPE